MINRIAVIVALAFAGGWLLAPSGGEGNPKRTTSDTAAEEEAAATAAEDGAWMTVLELDRTGKVAEARASYDAFVKDYPDSARIATAMERIAALDRELAAEEARLVEQIRATTDPTSQLDLCREYEAAFPEGPSAEYVRGTAAAAEAALQATAQEAERKFAVLVAEPAAGVRANMADQFLRTYAANPRRPEVERILAAARAEVAAAAERERQEAVGRPQRVAGIVLMAAGGAVGIAGGIYGAVTLKKYNDLKDECGTYDSGCSKSVRDDNFKRALTTDILLGTALVLAVTGIVVYAVAPGGQEAAPPPVTVGLAPAPDGDGALLGIGGEF